MCVCGRQDSVGVAHSSVFSVCSTGWSGSRMNRVYSRCCSCWRTPSLPTRPHREPFKRSVRNTSDCDRLHICEAYSSKLSANELWNVAVTSEWMAELLKTLCSWESNLENLCGRFLFSLQMCTVVMDHIGIKNLNLFHYSRLGLKEIECQI